MNRYIRCNSLSAKTFQYERVRGKIKVECLMR